MKPFLTVILLFFACLLVNFGILAATGKRKQRGRHHRGQRGSLAKSIPVNNGRAARDVSVSDGKVDESASEDSSSSSGIDETVAGRKRKHSDDGSVDDEESSASDTDVRPLVRTDAGFFVASADFDAVYRSLLSRPPSSSCSEPPSEPEDRRVRKDRLRIASFNAEWLFLFGGSGTVQCPGKGCPWQVSAEMIN